MRQILYVSTSTRPHDQAALDAILHCSRYNNALDGVTGLLWSDGTKFVQVIEGDERAVGDAMDRIRADTRHGDITVLHDRSVVERQFGSWSMDLRSTASPTDRFDERMGRMLRDASDTVGRSFGMLLTA